VEPTPAAISRRIICSIVVAALTAPAISAQKDTFSSVARAAAIGDIHGDMSALKQALSLAGVIDAGGKWSGGKTHLVQVGDVPDRGPDTKAIIEYLMDLEKQAKRAGGMVHVLVGNHDAMNVYGDLRYVSPPEFAAFVSPKSAAVREETIEAILKRDTPPDRAAARAKLEKEIPLGWVEHRSTWTPPDGAFGRWTASHNTLLKIDDTLFVHAGISPRVASMSISEINKAIREELRNPAKLEGGLVQAEDGPLWYRGMATLGDNEIGAHVDAVLTAYSVKRVVVGHTPTRAKIEGRLGGRVVNVDTGMSKSYSGPKDCLLIEDGKLFTMPDGKKTPLASQP
jgi:hypothetical protein